MSAKTGFAPRALTALPVATKVNGGRSTSSPACTPQTRKANTSASVPEPTPTPWATPQNAAIACSSEALAAQRAAGKPLVDLTVSNPTECGFSYDNKAILEALSNPAALRYEPNPQGLESARRAVAGYYAARNEEVSVEDIFLTTSTSEAYSYVFRTLCDPGDELLIPSPSYPLFDFLAEIQDVSLVRYPLDYSAGDRKAVND